MIILRPDNARKCKIFYNLVGRENKHIFQINSIIIEEPFDQWGLDVISEITPNSSK